MMFHLCHETGVLSLKGECPAHGGDECLTWFVPVDDEWSELRSQRDRAVRMAEWMERRLRESIKSLSGVQRDLTTSRRNVLGDVTPPLVKPDASDETQETP